TFAPLSLGTIITRYRRDKFPQQIASRSIATEMKQRLEGLDNIFPNDPRFVPVRNIASIWAERFQAPKTVSFPKGLVARRADNWRVLIAVADSLGYGATLRAAAIAIERAGFDPEAGLYEAIHQVFEQLQVDRIWVSELMQALREIENSPWASLTTS